MNDVAAARERAEDAVGLGHGLDGREDVLDRLLVGGVGELAALHVEDDGAGAVLLRRELLAQHVGRGLVAGARQGDVVGRLAAVVEHGGADEEDDDHPHGHDDPLAAHAERAEAMHQMRHAAVGPFFTGAWAQRYTPGETVSSAVTVRTRSGRCGKGEDRGAGDGDRAGSHGQHAGAGAGGARSRRDGVEPERDPAGAQRGPRRPSPSPASPAEAVAAGPLHGDVRQPLRGGGRDPGRARRDGVARRARARAAQQRR